MKKTRTLLLTVGIAISTMLIFSSCITSVPTITLEAPEDGSEFYAGYDVHFAAQLEDKIGIASYSIQITPVENGTDNNQDAVPFHYQNHWEMENETEVHLHQHDVIIPQDAAKGNYIFTLTCTNKKGRQTQVSVPIVIVWIED